MIETWEYTNLCSSFFINNFPLFQLFLNHVGHVWFTYRKYFWKQSSIKKTAISNYFVSLWKVCYWKENISKQTEITCLLKFLFYKEYLFSKWTSDQLNISSTFCSTDQRFIQKRNTTYRIHNLVNFTLMPCMYLGFFARDHT